MGKVRKEIQKPKSKKSTNKQQKCINENNIIISRLKTNE